MSALNHPSSVPLFSYDTIHGADDNINVKNSNSNLSKSVTNGGEAAAPKPPSPVDLLFEDCFATPPESPVFEDVVDLVLDETDPTRVQLVGSALPSLVRPPVTSFAAPSPTLLSFDGHPHSPLLSSSYSSCPSPTMTIDSSSMTMGSSAAAAASALSFSATATSNNSYLEDSSFFDLGIVNAHGVDHHDGSMADGDSAAPGGPRCKISARREKNRLAAERCRNKRNAMVACLQAEVTGLRDKCNQLNLENERLKAVLFHVMSQPKAPLTMTPLGPSVQAAPSLPGQRSPVLAPLPPFISKR